MEKAREILPAILGAVGPADEDLRQALIKEDEAEKAIWDLMPVPARPFKKLGLELQKERIC